jgi:hypothetical protein
MKSLFTIIASIITFFSFAQTDGWEVYNLSNSSIPFDKVFYLEFDHDGNLWGGTSVTNQTAHVFMFDGTNFVNHMSNKWVYDLKVDQNGNIWTLTSLSELSKYDGNSWTDIKKSDLSWYSSPLYIDANDNKWANPLFSRTLLKYDGTNWTTYDNSNTGIPDNKIICANGVGNNIYFGTNDSGIIHYDGSSWSTINTSNSPLPDNRIYATCKDNMDSLWFACRGGYIVSMKDGNWSVYHNTLFDDAISAIDVDSKGNVWLALTNKVFKIEKGSIIEFNENNSILPAFSILNIKIDQNDKVWIGSRYGLFTYKESIDTTITISSQPQGATVNQAESVSFTLEASGEGLSYQWQKDDLDIKFATTNTYQIASASASDAGVYKCIITNNWTEVESDEAVLVVNTGSFVQQEKNKLIENIYPNPVHDVINISCDRTSETIIKIVDLTGKVVFSQRQNANPFNSQISITKPSEITPGVYLLMMTNKKGSAYSQIIIK